MPLTLPSHAAAILPLTRVRWLPPSALVIGAAAPDLGYLLDLGNSHVWSGLLTTVLPAGLLLWLWTECLLLPLLREVLPTVRGFAPTRLLATRGVSLRPGALLAAAAAVLFGASTHLLWDGFTHDSLWPASRLYPAATVGLPLGLTVARVLQHLSTLGGGALVLLAWARAYRSAPEPAPALIAAWARGTWWRLLLVVVAGAALQCARELRWHSPETPWTILLWMGFWAASRGAVGTLTLLGAWGVGRRWRARRGAAEALGGSPPAT